MTTTVGSWGFAKRMGAIAATGAFALACATPAFAATASVDASSGVGTTDLKVRLADAGEHGGYGHDPDNPKHGDDDWGSNLAFQVPTAINYVAKADGTLIGPTTATIDNLSAFGVHVRSMGVQPEGSWSIVRDASAASAENAVDVVIGPEADQLNLADRLTGHPAVNDASEWNMSAKGGAADKLPLATSGHIGNVSEALDQGSTFGQVKWYLTSGTAS